MTQKWFPPIELIKEEFTKKQLFYEGTHLAIIVKYQDIDYKCRLKYDSLVTDENFWGDKKRFSLEIDFDSGKKELKGVYNCSNYAPIWIWPIFSGNIKIDMELEKIKKSYIEWPSFDWSEGFCGYILYSTNDEKSPEDIPLIYGDKDDQPELFEFLNSDNAKIISKQNGGV